MPDRLVEDSRKIAVIGCCGSGKWMPAALGLGLHPVDMAVSPAAASNLEVSQISMQKGAQFLFYISPLRSRTS